MSSHAYLFLVVTFCVLCICVFRSRSCWTMRSARPNVKSCPRTERRVLPPLTHHNIHSPMKAPQPGETLLLLYILLDKTGNSIFFSLGHLRMRMTYWERVMTCDGGPKLDLKTRTLQLLGICMAWYLLLFSLWFTQILFVVSWTSCYNIPSLCGGIHISWILSGGFLHLQVQIKNLKIFYLCSTFQA